MGDVDLKLIFRDYNAIDELSDEELIELINKVGSNKSEEIAREIVSKMYITNHV